MSNYQAELPAVAVGERTIAGHPPGLFVLFFAEAWERFSYYGMRALLVLYMVKHLSQPEVATNVLGFAAVRGTLESVFGPLAPQPLASQIYGLYTAFVYLTPFFGGLLADRVLGQRKTVVLGGVLMAAGHFVMAFESLFFPALLLIILGNGAFKPNISTQVGLLYPPGDPRRDRAFSIFYVGINLGAFFAPLVAGTLGELYGWHYGFSAAGVGMVIGLLVYLWGQRYLAVDNLTRSRAADEKPEGFSADEWSRVGALVVLCLLNVFFWAVYEQQGNTIALFADRNLDRTILGWEFPTTWVQSVNPFLIFSLTPLLTTLWGWQANRNREPSTVVKMSFGMVGLGLANLVLFAATLVVGDGSKVSIFWILFYFLFLTLGELYLSPVGLCLVTKVAPARIVSMMMGMWFLAVFAGNYLAGFLGSFWEKMPHGQFFLMMTGISFATAVAIWAFSFPLKKAMGVSADGKVY
jgi:POT family proton-dependent oligopeptide transporter